MKLNDIDLNLLTDKELVSLCLKYKLIEIQSINKYNRTSLLLLIKGFIKRKLEVYGQNNNRRLSISGNLQKNQINYDKNNNPIRGVRQRRLSQPITKIEKLEAVNEHNKTIIKEDSQNIIKQEIKSINPKYDIIGMYPPVKKLIAVGDLHGDLRVTIMALKLAEVIPQTSSQENINNIHWIGGDTWVIQLGDQIDRCRPDNWVQNCIEDYDDVYEDEGNNMAIIKLLLRLDDEARKVGGRLLGLLGNHELMNVDKDFRYVSPKEFLEFVPKADRNNNKKTHDGFPMGYYHRTKAFERGGNLAKLYSIKKKSIITIGSFIFVHGGLSYDLINKYSFGEINNVVSKWLCKNNNPTEENIFNEIFRDDDDMSPFWCRIYGEDDDENTERGFNELIKTINNKNKLLQPVKGMVIAHTPQFMDNKYLNSMYNDRLWRIDVGMSRAFGKHNDCREDKYRQIQILVIHNDNRFEVRKKPFNSERYPTENMGMNIDLSKFF